MQYAAITLTTALVAALLLSLTGMAPPRSMEGAAILAVIAPRTANVGGTYVVYAGIRIPMQEEPDASRTPYRLHLRICPASGRCLRTRTATVPEGGPPPVAVPPATDSYRPTEDREYWDWVGSFTPTVPGEYLGELLLLRPFGTEGRSSSFYRTAARSTWQLIVADHD